jgi:hypothetical protein
MTPSWRTLARGSSRPRSARGRRSAWFKPQCLWLEDRTVPANIINIVPGANGSGSLDSFLFDASPGTITTADGGANPGTVSAGALLAVAPSTDISVAALDSIIVNDLGGTLTLTQAAGHSVSFSSGTGVIDFINTANTLGTSGAALGFSAGTNLTAGNLNTAGGNANLTAGTAAAGNITAAAVLTGTGTVTFQATNAGGGQVTQFGSVTGATVNSTTTGPVFLDAVTATNATLTSTAGTVNSAASNPLAVSGLLTLQAAAGISVTTSASTLTAHNNGSGAIGIVQTAVPALPLTLVGAGVVNNAILGAITIADAGSSVVVNPGVTVQSNNGPIGITGLDLVINGTVNSGSGITTLGSSAFGRPIDLGSNTAGSVGITQAELDAVTAGVLRIGTGNDGAITVSLPVTRTTSPLTLFNNGPISETAGTITAGSLRVSSPGPVALTNLNDVTTLAGNTPSTFAFTNGSNSPLIIGVVDTITGITAANNDITLTANGMTIGSPVNAGTAGVNLRPRLPTVQINLGGADVAGTVLGLTDAELSQLTGGIVRIGTAANTGGITVSNTITRHAGYTNLDLITGGAVGQSASLAVANLAVQAAGTVTLNTAGNDADFLVAAQGAGTFTYVDSNALTVGGPANGAIDGVTGITSATSAAITVTATTGNLTLEQLISAGVATVTLTAPAGAILDGATPLTATNVIASGLAMTASTGIGTGAGAALNTQVNGLEAQTATGGIFVNNNTATLSLGGVSALTGVRVTTSGAIAVTNTGGITITVAGDALNDQNGTITLTATGATSDITTGGNQVAANINALGPNITLNAGRDVLVGSAGVRGSLTGGGGVILTAGRNVVINENSLVQSFSAPVTVTAGGNVSLLATTVAGARITGSGAITITTGVGGVFTLTSGAGGLVNSSSGGITVNADDMVIADPITSSGLVVTLRQAGATPRNIDLGTNSAGNLGLTNAELAFVTAGTLRVGRTNNTGSITVSAPITNPAGWTTLSLLSGGAVGQSGTGALTVPNLAVQAAGVALNTNANTVTTVVGTASAAAFQFTSVGSLTVGTVDAIVGVTATPSNVSLTVNLAGGTLTVSQAVTTTGATEALTADLMTINAALSDANGTVVLTPVTPARTVDLGTKSAGNLGLTDAELDRVTANVLRIGSFSPQLTGTITNTTAITQAGSGYTTLSLNTTGAITNGGGSITGTSLALRSGAGVGTAGTPLATSVANLAFANTGGLINLTNTNGSLTITSLDGLATSANTGTTTTLTTAGAAGTLAFTFAVNVTTTGTITATAGEIADFPVCAQNLTVNTGVTVRSTAGNVVLQAGDDIVLAAGSVVQSDNGSVTLTAAFNDADGCGALKLFGSIISPNSDVTLSSANDICVGTISAPGHVVTITSTTGQIIDCNDPPAGTLNITADKLAMKAAIGIGAGSGGAIETQVNSLEAASTTGGVFIDNTGALTLGGVTGAINGVTVGGAPGDIRITATGTITAATAGDNVTGPGNVTLVATGAGSDIVVNGITVSTTNGTTTLQAGRDILLGTGGTAAIVNTGGTSSAALTAGGKVVVDNGSALNAFGTGTVSATAGTDISVLHSTLPNAQIASASGTITLTTGPGGTFTLDSDNLSSALRSTLAGTGANITVSADRILLTTLDSIRAGTGIVTLQPVSPGRLIDVGSTTDAAPNTLELSNAELSSVLSASVIRVGSGTAGALTVTAPITPAAVATLSLRSGGAVTETAGGSLVVTNLAAQGASVALTGLANNVGTFAASSGGPVAYTNLGALTVGTVDGTAGISAGVTVAVATQAGSLTVSSPVTTVVGGAQFNVGGANNTFTNNSVITSGLGGGVTVVADRMALGAPVGSQIIASTGGRVVLRAQSAGRLINLGSTTDAAANTLELSAAELNTVTTTGTLQVGSAAAGNVTVSAAIAPAGVGTLDIETGGGVSQSAGATVTVANLAIRAANAVVLGQANDVAGGSLAASVSGAGQSFQFTDANSLAIGTADGLSGITTNGGAVLVGTNTGDLTVSANVSAGPALIVLAAGGLDSIFTNAAAISNSVANPIAVQGDRMALAAGSSITAAGGGRVVLEANTAGRPIDLGSAADPNGTLNLSDAELKTVTTTGVLQIGQGTEGNVTVSAAVAPTGVGTLSVIVAGGVAGPGGISVGNLRLSVGSAVNLPGNNTVGTLAGAVATAGQGFTFHDTGALTIGTVDGISGVTTNGGAVSVTTAAGNLTVSQNVAAGAASVALTAGGADSLLTNSAAVTGNAATLTADRIDLQGGSTVNAGAGIVTLQPFSAGRPVNLDNTAGDPTGELRLSQSELNTVTAGVLRVGSPTAGNLTVKSPITTGPGWTVLSLAGANVAEAGGSVTVTSLAVRASGAVTLVAGDVTTLAVAANGAVAFTDPNGLTIGVVDGVTGVVAGNHAVTITANDLDIQQAVSSGTATTILQPFTAGRAVSLGTEVAGELSLTDAELDRVAASVLQVGNTAAAGDIHLRGLIDQPTVGFSYATLDLRTAVAILDFTPGEQTDIAVNNLALRAATGIGSGNDLNVAVGTLAARNTNSGSVQVSNTGALTVGTAAGLSGVTDNGPGGNVALSAASPMTIDSAVSDTGGGNITITTTGANGAITVTVNGSITASGGNGNITLDASAATSGGTITVNNGPNAADISAAGTGNVTLDANDAVVIAAGAVVQSGSNVAGTGGTITLLANGGDPNGTDNVTVGAGAQLLTRGNVVLDADPDANCVGGSVVLTPGSVIAAPGGGMVAGLTIHAAGDIVLSDQKAGNTLTIATCGSLLDDGNDATFIQAPNIVLSAGGAIGGTAAISINDVLTQSGNYLNAVDFSLQGGTLTINQTAPGGNIQLHQVNGPLLTSTLAGSLVPASAGNQVALIGTGGLVVDAALTMPAAADANLLLAGVGGSVTINTAVTNAAPNAPTSVVSTGGAIVGPAAANGVADLVGGTLNLITTGGPIGAGPASPLEIDATTLNAASGGGNMVITDAAGGVAVGRVDAATGNVTLTSAGNSLTVVSPNDNVPDILGNVVTLAATGPADGATGQIGSFSGSAQFVEVQAAVLNASTNNSRLWIAAIGGVQVGHITAGTENPFLREVGGAMISQTVDGTADVVGGTVFLRGLSNGCFGNGAVPLEIDATTLNATATGTGLIDVTDTAGGLSVVQAVTQNGPVALVTQGPNGNLALTSVVAPNNGVTLGASGAITGVPATTVVTAPALVIEGAAGVGTAADPLGVSTNVVSANAGAGGLFLANAAGLTVGTVGGVSGITSGGPVTVTAAGGPLNVAQNVQGAGDVNLTAGLNLALVPGTSVRSTGGAVGLSGVTVTVPAGSTAQAAGALTLAGGVGGPGGVTLTGTAAGSSVVVSGGAGDDVFQLNPAAGSAPAVTVVGQAGSDTFNVTPNPATAFTISGGDPTPPATPGDTLNVALAGTTSPAVAATFNPALGFSGTWTFADRQPIAFDTIETLTPVADLSVTNTDGVTTVTPGTTVTYTVVVRNAGPQAANGARVTDPVPAGLTAVSYTSTATGGATGNTASGAGAINDLLNLPAGATVTYTITGLVSPSASGNLTSTATVAAPAGAADTDLTNNTATDTDTLVAAADLRVVVTAVADPVAAGGTVSYVVTVFNAGPSDASNAVLTANLPPGLTGATAAGSQGTVSLGLGTVQALLGGIAAGSSATLIVTGTASQPGLLTLTASATEATADPDPTNNSASKVVTVTPFPAIFAVGADAGSTPQVNVYDASGALKFSFLAYAPSFLGGVRVAVGDVTGDHIPDIITAAGAGGGPHVKVFDGATGQEIMSFFAYNASFTGGVFVAAGDVDGDGRADIITGAGAGGGPHVKVFSGATGQEIRSFFAYDGGFTGGVTVAAGDLNGDGRADIVTGAGAGGGPHVKAFDAVTGAELQSFFAFAPEFTGGVFVAAGDFNGDGHTDIAVGAGAGGGPHVKVFDGSTLALEQSFFAYGSSFTGGVRVGSLSLGGTGPDGLVTGAGPGGSPHVKLQQDTTLRPDLSFFAFDPAFLGGVFVG